MQTNRIIIILFIIIYTCGVFQARAQEFVRKVEDSPYIAWISQYPPLANEKPKRSLGTRIAELILGKKNSMELTRPVGVIAKDSLSLYVLDQENGVIFKVKDKVGEITHFRNKKYKNFPSLVGITPFKENSFLFTDSYYNKIFLCTPDKKSLTLLTDSTFDRPTGIAWVPSDHRIWLVETNAHRVSVLDEYGKVLKRFGKRGTAPGEFNYPTSVWVDRNGKVYIVDALNFRIQIFSADGEFISQFGKPGDGSGDFARPKGIATDSYGNIYIADALFSAVQIFNPQGQLLYTFGTRGHGNMEFWMPSGIYIDNRDQIYIADSYNSRIQVFQLMNGGK
ncbi:MAG: 6-bladed beta-propeller [Bacteroidales bacterium]|jgi:DNA-binding beta-propeller fold protein YncE|nr:6-bladed beta-propeller [Bacteroidales bacterium]